ncbi:hypothetical protein A9Q81_12650 [Gammaproteobacteria bacterium 42_54_T18]|nr:hypothetical protein A9Q81_12650 [Gammaproteobacteria bacterium 42_54_T18]
MQALFAFGLKPIAETTGDKHSYGFREKRSLHDASKQGFIILAQKIFAQWILEADIKACFDRISHEWLLKNIPLPKRILGQWLKSGFIEGEHFLETEDGTPQGGIISPILCNMALDGLEGFQCNEPSHPLVGLINLACPLNFTDRLFKLVICIVGSEV